MKKVIFLDRDGTLNVDSGYVFRVEDWQWVDGAIDALKQLSDAGYELAVVTNQSGIARDYYTVEDMNILHEHMAGELEKHGVRLSFIAHCPHNRPEGEEELCNCRKPSIGMAQQVEEAIGPIDFSHSWMIGDKIADLMFGKTAGTNTALIRSRYWEETDLPEQPNIIVDSLAGAVSEMVAAAAD